MLQHRKCLIYRRFFTSDKSYHDKRIGFLSSICISFHFLSNLCIHTFYRIFTNLAIIISSSGSFQNFLCLYHQKVQNRVQTLSVCTRVFLSLLGQLMNLFAGFLKSKMRNVFNVTPIPECPIIYCSVLGFIRAAAILKQNVCLHT